VVDHDLGAADKEERHGSEGADMVGLHNSEDADMVERHNSEVADASKAAVLDSLVVRIG